MPETWKPPGDHDAALPQRRCDVERARKLIRLYADQHHHSGAGLFQQRGNLLRADTRIGFVEGVYVDLDVVAERFAFGAIHRQTIKYRQRVRWNG
ncbi:hypothetical protein RP726_19420 [Candidatus Methylospira mobilis]|uniref:hypothetical protein n=1 Tax=Candidatus Methylospira mobilis TaxID=1808979 RepID=UPI001D17CA8A|nr:hypothetical protein [Candidatus Methylospira mobilis]WNV04540.1 hypothetical protein RP726_19420 [Candidatus Methylospira mobilis]